MQLKDTLHTMLTYANFFQWLFASTPCCKNNVMPVIMTYLSLAFFADSAKEIRKNYVFLIQPASNKVTEDIVLC